ncbi:MAG TPA: class I SAM-dependent methyltransferase [Planctomycetota bacterium]|nr:class I SAM-dependent methyltransferase [Planctomycetota bacterium]
MDFDTLWRDGIGFWRVWVLTLGKRHGLFDSLRRPPANDAVRLWRDAALALGLISAKGRPAPGVTPLLLDRHDPDYLAGHLMYGALRSLDYDAMGDFFRSGRTLELLSRPRRNEAVEEATDWDHVMFLRKLPRDLRERLRRGCDVLELGCGTGRWLRMMRKQFPRSRFHGVDPDPDTGAEVGFAETAGKAASADVVYLGEVLHLTDRRRTLANCARVLRPGGHLLVLEGFMPERVSTRKWEAVLFAMQLDQALQGARFMKRSELELPKEFGTPRFIRLGGCVALAVGRRRG